MPSSAKSICEKKRSARSFRVALSIEDESNEDERKKKKHVIHAPPRFFSRERFFFYDPTNVNGANAKYQYDKSRRLSLRRYLAAVDCASDTADRLCSPIFFTADKDRCSFTTRWALA